MKETYEEKINRRLGVKQRIIAVASGREKADLVLKNAMYLNVSEDEIPRLIADTGSAVQYHGYGGRGQVQPLGQFLRCNTHFAHLVCS